MHRRDNSETREPFTMFAKRYKYTYNIILMLVVFINASAAIMEELSPGKFLLLYYYYVYLCTRKVATYYNIHIYSILITKQELNDENKKK